MDYKAIANSSLMFILCFIVIAFVIIYTVLLMRRAWKRGLEMGMSKKAMKKAITGSATFSIVPSIPILIVLVTLMSVLGNYFPWLRLSVIGSSSYESMAANTVAQIYGLASYTAEGFNETIFLSAMWAMTICILYEPILIGLGLVNTVDKALGKIRYTRPVLFSLFLSGVFTALMGWFCAPYLTNLSDIPALTALLVAGIFAIIFHILAKKLKMSIFAELSFPVSMLIGMAGAMIVSL